MAKKITEGELYKFTYKEVQKRYVGGLMPNTEWLNFRRRLNYFWNKLKEAKMNKKETAELIKKRIRFHRVHFERYRKEAREIAKMKYISKKNQSQLKYSYEQMGRELGIIDELKLVILNKIEPGVKNND